VVFCLAAAIVLLSLASFSPADPVFEGVGYKAANLIGMVGAYLADGLLSLLGIASFLLAAALVYGAVVAFSQGGVSISARKCIGFLALSMLGTVFCHLVFSGNQWLGHPPGGVVGEYMGGLFVSLLSTTGSVVLVTFGMILGLIEVTGFSPVRCLRLAGRGIRTGVTASGRGLAWTAGHIGRGTAKAAIRS
jgi:DNA segregation ATPase FtsK/SpoIIIE, S-DNA-T family